MEGGADGVHAVTLGAVAHGRVLEAETGQAALRVVWIQVKEAEFTPEEQKGSGPTARYQTGRQSHVIVRSPVTAEALHVVFAATLPRVDVTLLSAA